MNNKKWIGLAVAVSLLFVLAGCSQDLRNVKVSKLTIEQEEKVMKQLTREEVELVTNYQMRMAFGQVGQMLNEVTSVITGKKDTQKQEKNVDLTINEIIKAQQDYVKSNPSQLSNISNIFGAEAPKNPSK